MINIILSGGSGTRLWPISRTLEPKQFCKLINNISLFQETVLRNKDFCNKQFIVLNSEQYFMALDQLEEIDLNNSKYLLESVGRNTAPAIALACMELEPDDLVLVTPSDHLIKDLSEYNNILKKAKILVEKDYIVTFGITPNYPETGYGYIEAKGEDVIKFHEKPSVEIAKTYLEKGNYYWNSGIFAFKVKIYLNELKKYSPEIFEKSKIAYENAKKNTLNSLILRISEKDMQNIPDESIDFAVMEKSKIVKVIPSFIGWSDLGSFESLYDVLPKDESNTTVLGEFGYSSNKLTDFKNYSAQNNHSDKHINIDAKNNLIFSSNRTIATVDIEDLIIVDTPDALLVTKKGSSAKVRDVVQILKNQNSALHSIHLTAHRPWGTYKILEESERYKIKKIVVKPGKRLSLQKHFHRSEHWVVVSGTALVTSSNTEKTIKPNESFYIPIGELHRLENPGKLPLVLIEVQVGEYLGEDDIVRVEDDFKRV